MKKYIWLMAVISLFSINSEKLPFEFTGKATGKDWPFEIQNKSSDVLSVTVSNGNNYLRNAGVAKGSTEMPRFLRIKGLDSGKPVVLEMTDGRKNYNFQFNNWKGKNLYFTYDANGLRPQTGLLKGFSGSTTSGLNNKNKVTDSDIKNAQALYLKEHNVQAKNPVRAIEAKLTEAEVKKESEDIFKEIKKNVEPQVPKEDVKGVNGLLDQIKKGVDFKKVSKNSQTKKDVQTQLLDQIRTGNVKLSKTVTVDKSNQRYAHELEGPLLKVLDDMKQKFTLPEAPKSDIDEAEWKE